MAKRLPALFDAAGLGSIEVHQCEELVRRGDPDFFDAYASGIWVYVIQSVGPQLVASGLLDEEQRSSAEEQYTRYVQTTLQRQIYFAVTVKGTLVDRVPQR